MKNLLMIGLIALVGVAHADNTMSSVFISPQQVVAGDFTTAISFAPITDNSKPWYVKDLSATALVLGDVASDTSTAVAFTVAVPNNLKQGIDLYAIVKPAASDTTVKLKADVQVQGSFMGSPTTVTTQTWGSASAALAAGANDNLTYLRLPNTAIAGLKKNEILNVYVGRSAGTGENLYIHGFLLRYVSDYFGNR